MKHLIKQALHAWGLEIQRYHPLPTPQPSRQSFQGCLHQAIQNGLTPQTVIDVGVATGTPDLYQAFPSAFHLLIEPLVENLPYLEHWKQQLAICEYRVAAAARQAGQMTINVHPDLVGSSLYKETEGPAVDGIEREIATLTLNGLVEELNLSGPYLIKIDTQGSELDVLEGAARLLPETEFIVLEVSFFNFFQDAPMAYDYIHFMKERGFVIYDIFDLSYRLLDGALSQVNMAFVRADSKFRQVHIYANPKQRQEQDQRLLAQEYVQQEDSK
jgi:FkbM family methyltransferase